MKVTEQDVAHVAALANLDLTADERGRMLRDLNHILDYIDRLNQLDTSGVGSEAGSDAALAVRAPAEEGMRPDEPAPCLSRHDALANAPASDGTFFTVPKVIER